MADDKPEDAGLGPESGRAKRTPPTIDLEATEVSTQPQHSASGPETEPTTEQASYEPAGVADTKPEADNTEPHEAEPHPAEQAASQPEPERAGAETVAAAANVPPSASPPISPWIIAPFSGAVAAAIVIGIGWMLGWPAVQAPPSAPQVTSATVDALSGRVASLEAKVDKISKPAVDPAVTARIDAQEKSIAALRGDIANLRTQSDKTASAVAEAKSAPRDAAAASVVAALSDRVAQLERASTSARAELAQQGEKIAEAKVADDKPLRHVVAASLLDVAVRHGDAYGAQLAAARSYAADPGVLKPLDAFASTGIPTPVALSREPVST